MVSSVTEKNYREEVILSEAQGSRSRDTITLLTGTAYKAGMVLGKITSGGKYTLCDNETPASDGSQTAAAVLLEDIDATGADAPGLILKNDAEVKAGYLVYKAGTSDAHKLAQRVSLETVGRIKVR